MLAEEGSGEPDTVGADGVDTLPLQSKSAVAGEILDRVEKLLVDKPVKT